ncbi:MAG: NAD-dependent DNA ligase LigA [Muribaculaceae bacterium]|nr:NAD-dependent DNA ligase LigA [Muribaculaceae bacterium]
MDCRQQRLLDLRDILNRHNYNYYVLNAPEISDRDFDMLMKELEALEAEFPEMADPYSPTQRVGSDLSDKFEQARHIYPMLSLSNTYSIHEVDEWFGRVRGALEGEKFEVVGEMKYDGTSISLIYEHGRLVRAVTRGDGERGDVVTANIKTIKSIPLELRGSGWPDMFEIRGEILMPWKEFDRLNKEREYNEEPLFANPRNAASGTLKTLDSREVARRGLDAFFYYLLGPDLPFDNHYANMMAAREWGFKVSPTMTLLHSLEQVDQFINHWDTARRELPVATDGLVFKVNNLRQQLNLGYTAKSPRWAVAYKFPAERACTRLRFVSFEVGRMGIVTPVANLDPVLLSGTVVKRASLHNEDIIRSLDIHEEDMLYVEKGGEIIPKITGVDENGRLPGAKPVRFVHFCPACATPLVRVEGEASWQCPNRFGCQPQIAGRIEHFVGRKMMNIEGIGEETVEQLYKRGYIKNITDLYDLTTDQLLLLDGFGPRSAERVLEGLEASKSIPYDRVIYALSIPFVGDTVARKVAKAFPDIDLLMAATTDQLAATKDIGPRIAQSITEYFANPANRETVARLRAAGLQFAAPEESTAGATDLLGGKTFVISGTFTHHSRDEYKDLIERNGGKNVSSISRKTDYVFAGANMGPAKLEKATSLGIPIIDEATFLDMISQPL